MLEKFNFFIAQIDEPSQAGIGNGILHCCLQNILLTLVYRFTEKKHQHGDDPGMGPSTFTDTKISTFSEVS